MVQTGAALALIATTLLALLYFATIKYVSDVLVEDEDHEGNTNSGGPAA